jgi:glycosyltransferase involved in cell wall biosynthesis
MLKKRLSIKVENILTSLVDRNVCVSHMNKTTGIKHLTNFEAEVIQNGVDTKSFNPDRLDYNSIRKELGVENEAILVGYFARITKQKDPMTLLLAFKRIASINRNIKLLIVGDGDLKEEVLGGIKNLGLQNLVFFEGFRQDVPDLLHAIDIYCLPSLWEGLSIGLLEAMAMQKAIIATNVDGTMEVIKNMENGILIKPEDPRQLAQAIVELADDPQLRQRLAHGALTTVQKNFSVERMVDKVKGLYQNLV